MSGTNILHHLVLSILGIGGDRTENVLWRMEEKELPPTVEYLFIHCETNKLCTSSCKDIADGILALATHRWQRQN